MRHYCTLFDRDYAAKGLALHESLLRHSSEEFCLHILCLDMDTFWLLSEMKLKNVELIPLGPFERALKLEPVRDSRTHQEYAWTLASCLMEYLLPCFDELTYLDADLFFFSDPKRMFSEMELRGELIGITPHRFSEKDRVRLGKNGEYNVGVVIAKNSAIGLLCISTWAEQCREWCFNRNESGKFGDQAYLDSWPTMYPRAVCEIENCGVNLGPWSIGNHEIFRGKKRYAQNPDSVYVQNRPYGAPHLATYWELVCYHFHEFQGPDQLTNWRLRPEDKELIYAPYVKAFLEAKELIQVTKARLAMRRDDLAEQGARA